MNIFSGLRVLHIAQVATLSVRCSSGLENAAQLKACHCPEEFCAPWKKLDAGAWQAKTIFQIAAHNLD